jgi:hypothetical protein
MLMQGPYSTSCEGPTWVDSVSVEVGRAGSGQRAGLGLNVKLSEYHPWMSLGIKVVARDILCNCLSQFCCVVSV